MDGKEEDSGPARATTWVGATWKGLVPLGVAACVALAIGGGTDFANSLADPPKPKKDRSAKAAAGNDEAAPRYVVGVRGSGEALVVRNVRTGRDMGLPVAAPQSQRFQRVASADDGSFVVSLVSTDPSKTPSSSRSGTAPSGTSGTAPGVTAGTASRSTPGTVPGRRQVTFQRLRLDEDGRPRELTPLPRATVPGTSAAWSDLAVSEDGDSIAYVTYRPGARPRLDVVSAKTGERKVWTSRTRGRVGSLSWAGSMLSFVWSPARTTVGRGVPQVRSLDTSTAAPGNLSVSKTLLKLPKGSGQAAVVSRDGRSVVAGVAQDGRLKLQSYGLPAGRPAQVLWQRDEAIRVSRLTTDHTGGHVLVSAEDGTLYTEYAQTVPGKDLLDAAW
jgi:hypothetical protein